MPDVIGLRFRAAGPDPQARTIIAETETGDVVGLAHTILGEDPVWGAFLDNLHVAYGLKRQGVGARLLA
jgi:predicted N-acetyltransferase YhbS